MNDVITAINHSISIVTRLREISKNITQAEFKNLLADLSNELADAKLNIANLKEQIAEQAEELRALKTAAERVARQKPKTKWGCYQFEGEEGLYCTACYDTKGAKSITTRLSATRRMCPVCNALFGS
jgi:hypothetical protein